MGNETQAERRAQLQRHYKSRQERDTLMGRFIDPENSLFARRSRADHLVALSLVVIIISLAFVTTLEDAFAVAGTVGVLAGVVQQEWSSRSDPRLWALVAMIGAIQIPAIVLVHIPRLSTGLVAIPFTVIEGLALLRLFAWIERRFPRAERSPAR